MVRSLSYEIWFRKKDEPGKWWVYLHNETDIDKAKALKNGFLKQGMVSKVVEVTVSSRTVSK